MANILCVNLNPAIDVNQYMGQTTDDEPIARIAGGKGLNIARTLTLLGYDPSNIHIIGFVGGETGTEIVAAVEALGIHNHNIQTTQPTRTINTWLDRSREKEPRHDPYSAAERRPLSAAELEEFRSQYTSLIDGIDVIIFSGSAPEGVQKTIYKDLIAEANEKGLVTILDSRDDYFSYGMQSRPDIVFPNLAEARDFTGKTDILEIRDALSKLTTAAVVTAGEDGAYLFYRDSREYVSPEIDVLNTTGAGDAVVAGTVHYLGDKIRKLKQKLSAAELGEAVKYGVACGTVAASHSILGAGLIDRSRVEDMHLRISLHHLLGT